MKTVDDYLKNKRAILLDMNGTFMFGEDRFDATEDFSVYYSEIGGELPSSEVNKIVRQAYSYLDVRYPDVTFRDCFPSLEHAVNAVTDASLNAAEVRRIVRTFSFHELGHIPRPFADAIHQLHDRFVLAAVVDIWSPKAPWIAAFQDSEIIESFSAMSFSSDHGSIKPSPKPFQQVVQQLGIQPSEALMVGDSVRRDLGGAMNAGIECVLVGGSKSDDAVCCVDSLLKLLELVT